MLVPLAGSPGASGASPATMPCPELWYALFARIVWPPSATLMPLSAFSFVVLPWISAPPIGPSVSGSNAPPSTPMPAPPVRFATLFSTLMLRPLPISKPVWSESDPLLPSIVTSFELLCSTPLGLKRRSESLTRVLFALLRTTPPSDSWWATMLMTFVPSESWTMTPASPLRYMTTSWTVLSFAPMSMPTPASPVSRISPPLIVLPDEPRIRTPPSESRFGSSGIPTIRLFSNQLLSENSMSTASPRLPKMSLLDDPSPRSCPRAARRRARSSGSCCSGPCCRCARRRRRRARRPTSRSARR